MLIFGREDGLPQQDYLAFCRVNPNLRCELTSEGEVVIIPPSGGELSYRHGKILGQLARWSAENGIGKTFDSSVEFLLPDGSALSPDASWVSNESLAQLTPAERHEFLRLSPEFVIEVISPSDRLKAAKQKMEAWISNGVQLAWLIDADHRSIYVYRRSHNPVTRKDLAEIAGEGPLKSFVLTLAAIWKGLR